MAVPSSILVRESSMVPASLRSIQRLLSAILLVAPLAIPVTAGGSVSSTAAATAIAAP